jgi:hypothetical protein
VYYLLYIDKTFIRTAYVMALAINRDIFCTQLQPNGLSMATHSDVCEKETEVLHIIELIFVFKILTIISMDVDQMVTRPIQFQSVLNVLVYLYGVF